MDGASDKGVEIHKMKIQNVWPIDWIVRRVPAARWKRGSPIASTSSAARNKHETRKKQNGITRETKETNSLCTVGPLHTPKYPTHPITPKRPPNYPNPYPPGAPPVPPLPVPCQKKRFGWETHSILDNTSHAPTKSTFGAPSEYPKTLVNPEGLTRA